MIISVGYFIGLSSDLGLNNALIVRKKIAIEIPPKMALLVISEAVAKTPQMTKPKATAAFFQNPILKSV